MLFGIFLVIGITIMALGVLFVLGTLLTKLDRLTVLTGLVLMVIGVILITSGLWLPPIPIIPQG